MILNSAFPPDFRVEKETQTLLSAHEVFVLCTRNGSDVEKETVNGVHITRIFDGVDRRRATWQLMRGCYSKLWRREIDRFTTQNRLDVLHAHDLPVAGTALKAARSHRIPIVLDLHEDYPELLNEIRKMPWRHVPSLGVLGLKAAPSIDAWREYERQVAREADAVVAVVDESADRLERIGVERSRIHVVPNYGPVPTGESAPRNRDSSTVTAVYFGGFDQARDLRTVLHAADILKQRGCADLRIVLIGGSSREISFLRRYAVNNQLDVSSVSFHEWMDREVAEKILSGADIGLVPHVKSVYTDSTIPNKLFQYTACRLPVVASNCAPLERIVESEGCGLIYASGDATSLADCIDDLYRNPGKRMQMGNAGFSAATTRYSWSVAADELLDLYRQLGKARLAD